MKEEGFISINKVTKKFGDFYAVDDLSLDIAKGEIFALLGSSGCGKTTLLRMLAGFEFPDTGEIRIEGKDISNVPPYRRPLNMMFQSYALFPHLNVLGNVCFGLKQERLPSAEVKRRANEAIGTVGLSGFEKRRIDQLSGGQRQRVALARIIAKQPKALLLDEPLAALDKNLRERMQLELVTLLKSLHMTCIIVTHDQEEAMTMATRIAVMTQGVIKQIGTPRQIYETPNSKFVAEFIGNVNLLDGKVIEDEVDHVKIQSEYFSKPIFVGHGITCTLGDAVNVAIRPEKIKISAIPCNEEFNSEEGVVKKIQYFGDMTSYFISMPSGYELKCTRQNELRDTTDTDFSENDKVFISWDKSSPVVMTS